MGLVLSALHFGLPLLYYTWALKTWYPRDWGVSKNAHLPKITVVVPTYNEARRIWQKLENLYSQKYPRNLVDILLVDSASVDGTVEIAERWSSQRRDAKLTIIKERHRLGKISALNNALTKATGDIVVITDADATWAEDALLKTATYFADTTVGAVTCIKKPAGDLHHVESHYRKFYNAVRVAESKAFATPIFHGELAAFRRDILERIGGFPPDVGADDSYAAVRIASMGYRAIAADDIVCIEEVPHGSAYHTWRIRRAQHLIQSFSKGLRHLRAMDKRFKPIFLANAYLHLANPWLLAAGAAALSAATICGSAAAAALIVAGTLLALYRPYRTWAVMQIYLMAASVRNIWDRQLIWKKTK